MYEELVKELRNAAKHIWYGSTMVEAADAIESMCEMVADAYGMIANMEADKPHWIPVTEKLPDNIDEEVLVCNEGYGKDGTGFATVAVYNGNGWLECWERKQYLSCITHWMPLPEPPKEGR